MEKQDQELLEELRKKINSVDINIVNLLDDRARLVKDIGEYKKSKNLPIYQPDREKDVKERVLAAAKNEFPPKALMHIFTEIVSAARSLEAPLEVGFLGPEGSYTEQAAIKHFGSSVNFHPLPGTSDIFREIENGKIDFGIVPIENTLGGTVYQTLDEFVDSPVKIISETFLTINHNLMGMVEDKSQIKRIYSHPQSFAQCRIWLETHMPNVEKIETSSNSKAASQVPWDKFSAAIAGEIAADRYGLHIIERNIEDNPENYTRFWIIAPESSPVKNPEKTTILVSVKDKPGALLRLLSPFQVFGLNLSKIESRPSRRRPWDYLFFIDIDGSIQSGDVNKAIEKIKEDSIFLKILGSYPKGEL
ncbi:MAG: prephenate dehydratase [Brevinematales bacterium]|nr:prephenate dehydratase [Brevinematales bacterium]